MNDFDENIYKETKTFTYLNDEIIKNGAPNSEGIVVGDIFIMWYKKQVFFFRVVRTSTDQVKIIELAKNRRIWDKKDGPGYVLASRTKRTTAPKILTREQNKDGIWVNSVKNGKKLLYIEHDYRRIAIYPIDIFKNFEEETFVGSWFSVME